MTFWGVVGAIAAGWCVLSVLIAAGWALLRHCTRTDADRLRDEADDLVALLIATAALDADDELLGKLHRAYVTDGIEQVEQFLKAGDR